MKKVKLVLKGNTPGYINQGSHIDYDIMLDGVKIGCLCRRVSKDTYSVEFIDMFKCIDTEYFRIMQYSKGLFMKTTIEDEMSEIFTHMFVMLTNPYKFKKGDRCVYIGEVGGEYAVLEDDMVIDSDAKWYEYAPHPNGGYWQYSIKGKANECPQDLLQLYTNQKIGDPAKIELK